MINAYNGYDGVSKRASPIVGHQVLRELLHALEMEAAMENAEEEQQMMPVEMPEGRVVEGVEGN